MSGFSKKFSTSSTLVSKIKEEVAMWCLAGAKSLSNVMPRVRYFFSYAPLTIARLLRPLKTFFLINKNDNSFVLFQKKSKQINVSRVAKSRHIMFDLRQRIN